MKSDTEKFEMLQAMEHWGGNFVKALAQCFYHADRENTNRLYAAFPEYVEKYSSMAQAQSARHAVAGDAETARA